MLYSLVLLSSLTRLTAAVGPVVDLGYSEYNGTALSSSITQWLGIRYAAPPLEDLRFRAPQEPPETTGIQSAQQVWSLYRTLVPLVRTSNL